MTIASSPSKSMRFERAGIRMVPPEGSSDEGGLRKSSGSLGTSLPSSAAWSR